LCQIFFQQSNRKDTTKRKKKDSFSNNYSRIILYSNGFFKEVPIAQIEKGFMGILKDKN
jgi:hypothetical protein